MLVLGRARRAHVPDFPELIGTCVRCCPERVEQLATPRWARRCDRGGNLIPILPYNRATKGLGVSCAARYRVSDSEVKRIGGNEKGRNIPGWLGELHASEVKHETRGTRVPTLGT